MRWAATRFHRSLGNAPYFKTIITTNWDRYFENILEATPFVFDSDIPFWESAKRSVLKIHGSIDNYSSIIASTEDYNVCEERLRQGALGAVVKQIFATKTCIFAGYSARDKDFRRIFRTIKDGLGQFARSHDLVSPFISEDEEFELKSEFGIIAIRTDATHFINTVKHHMQDRFCFAHDESFVSIGEQLSIFREMHNAFVGSYDVAEQPHLVFATAYQDGVIHAFERILDRAMTGEFSDLHEVQRRISAYSQKIADYKKSKNYWDLAYFKGYQNGLLQFLFENEKSDEEVPSIPECFHPGVEEVYLEDFDDTIRPNPEIHKAALKVAKRIAAGYTKGSQIIVQHQPWG